MARQVAADQHEYIASHLDMPEGLAVAVEASALVCWVALSSKILSGCPTATSTIQYTACTAPCIVFYAKRPIDPGALCVQEDFQCIHYRIYTYLLQCGFS